MEKPLAVMIMETLLKVVQITVDDLADDDPSRLRLVELKPRAEEFADLGLSCSISHNDSDDQEQWNDEEAAAPGSQYAYYSGKRHLELGLNQPWNMRFTIDFQLFYQELGIDTIEALAAAELMIARIHHAFALLGESRNNIFGPLYKGDYTGNKLIDATRSVKRSRVITQGSDEETFLKAKMWLQFTTLLEPEVTDQLRQYIL